MTGEHGDRLAGGNVGGAWRIGDTVRRTTGPWTPAVHALLDFLAPRLAHIPRVLGFDERGREVLTYLPGHVVDVDAEVLSAGQLASMVTWTRHFHEAVAGFDHPGPSRFFDVESPVLIGHNDIAPYNVCFDGDELVGVFDWDFAGPSSPLLELAFLAWNGVPLWRDIGSAAAAQRLEIIATAYGWSSAAQILRAVPCRVALVLDGIPLAAAAGDPGMANLMADGEPARSQLALDDLVRRIPGILAELRWAADPRAVGVTSTGHLQGRSCRSGGSCSARLFPAGDRVGRAFPRWCPDGVPQPEHGRGEHDRCRAGAESAVTTCGGCALIATTSEPWLQLVGLSPCVGAPDRLWPRFRSPNAG